VLQALALFGRFLDLDFGPLGFFSGFVLFCSFVLLYIAWTVGFGAVLITRFGTYATWQDLRRRRFERAPGEPARTAEHSVTVPPIAPAPPKVQSDEEKRDTEPGV
jgi:hypothetical protein